MRKPIGQFLADLRREKGATQKEIAEQLGISNKTLSSWEQGRAYPDILTLPALAELYGVTADEILAGERSKTEHSTGAMEDTAEKSDEGAYVNLLVRAAVKNTVLMGVGLGCALMILLLIVVGNFLLQWLCAFLFVVTVGGLVVTLTLFIVFDKSALASAGIRSGSGLSAEQEKMLYSLHCGELRAVKAVGLGWLISGLLSFVVCAVIYEMSLTILGWTMVLTGIFFGAAILVAVGALKSAEIYARGEAAAAVARRANVKLLKRCVFFTAIPVAVIGVVWVIFYDYIRYEAQTLYSAPREEFISYMHTFTCPATVAEEGFYTADVATVMARGDFAFGEIFPLSDGIYCKITPNLIYICFADELNNKYDFISDVSAERLYVYGQAEEGQEELMAEEYVYNLRQIPYTVSSETYYGLASFVVRGYGLGPDILATENDYILRQLIRYDYSSLVFSSATTGLIISLAAGTAVYIVKRKKYRA